MVAFFLRVFPVPTFRFWTYVLIVITAGYEVASVFATLFNCHPVARSWDLTIEGHCLNWNAFYFTSVGLEVFTDLGTIAIIM
ncbi:hypothetical protein KEM52_005575 [Ascosphaera acerosa]|nr:hypothetical protein KEM52_005575 [Ascosphaera acerosa]